MLKIKCPTCKKLLQGDDNLRGTVQHCPQCRHFVEIDANTLPVRLYQGRPGPIPLRTTEAPPTVTNPQPVVPQVPEPTVTQVEDPNAFAWIDTPEDDDGRELTNDELQDMIDFEAKHGQWDMVLLLQEKLNARQKERPTSWNLLWFLILVSWPLLWTICSDVGRGLEPGPLKDAMFWVIFALAGVPFLAFMWLMIRLS